MSTPPEPAYTVKPRYSTAPAAVVDEETAVRIAQQELRLYACALNGSIDDEWRMKAARLGVAGIVESHYVRFGRCYVEDLITGTISVQTLN